MILSGSGQNIYPEEIEDKLNNMYLVLESLVLDCGGRLRALVVPDYDQAEQEGGQGAAAGDHGAQPPGS